MRRHLWLIIRIALTLGLFWWLLRDPALRSKVTSLPSPTDPAWLGAAWISAGLNELLGFMRFWCCAHLAGMPITLRRAASLHFLGLFTSLFMPGTVGGDAVKIALLAAQFPDRKFRGVLAALMDRLSGFVVIMLWTFFVAGTRADWFRQTPQTATLFHAVMVFLLVTGGGLLFWYVTSRPRFVHRHPKWLPGREYVIRIACIFDDFLSDKRKALGALLLSVGTHSTFFFTFYFTALGYGAKWSLFDAFSVLPLMDIVAMLPITFSGLGLREATLQTFLIPLCGIPGELAIITSLAGFLISATWALGGAPVFLCSRSLAKPDPQHV